MAVDALWKATNDCILCHNMDLFQTIQDMNSLKRRVKQAELDFYALYR